MSSCPVVPVRARSFARLLGLGLALVALQGCVEGTVTASSRREPAAPVAHLGGMEAGDTPEPVSRDLDRGASRAALESHAEMRVNHFDPDRCPHCR